MIGAHPALLVAIFAVVVRLIVFLGRGDYIAFDEGWYLLLGRSVFDGEGYSLAGLRHTTLSPLFPLVAGAAGRILGDIVWGGRVVAAVAAGLLVIPCWHVFRRLSDARVASIACLFIAVMPSLAPFAAPFWIGWDLWVGAEPVLHLFLYSGIALALRARDRKRTIDWALAGVAFGLAYLARPEGIVVFGLVGMALGIGALVRRSAFTTACAIIMALSFAATAAPYWIYLHDTLGRWALSGRVVQLPALRTDGVPGGDAPDARAAAIGIERMLWQDDNTPYVQVLYGLDESRTRLGSTYWGVPASDVGPALVPDPVEAPPAPAVQETRDLEAAAPRSAAGHPVRWQLYASAIGIIVPWFLWPLIIVGAVGRRRALRQELLVVLPLVITSAAVARLVGADPRTQLFIVPVAAFYAAWGVRRVGDFADTRFGAVSLRPGFLKQAGTLIVTCALLAILGRWVYLGLSMGSPHHSVGAANRAAGEALSGIVAPDEPVMSWHPAHALYADRAWRVLPYAPLPDIVRYANAIDCEYILLSTYYPGSGLIEGLPQDHIVLEVPPGAPASAESWSIEMRRVEDAWSLGRLVYAAGTTAEKREP